MKENSRLKLLSQNANKRFKANRDRIALLKSSVNSLTQNQKLIVEETKRSLNDFKASMKNDMSIQVANKMKVRLSPTPFMLAFLLKHNLFHI
jgi:hypothetical protein